MHGGPTYCKFWFISVASSYDVRNGTYRLNINPRVHTVMVNVPIRDDKLIEGTEAFGAELFLYGYNKPYCLKLGKLSITTVLIKDGMYNL